MKRCGAGAAAAQPPPLPPGEPLSRTHVSPAPRFFVYPENASDTLVVHVSAVLTTNPALEPA